MSGLSDLAEGLSAGATFLTSSIGSGVISFLVYNNDSCSGGGFTGEPYVCRNVFGGPPMGLDEAGTFGTVTGFILGGAALLIREAVLDAARKRGEEF